MTERLETAIDVSAIPVDPVGAGTYVIELVRALDGLDSAGLQLYARREDGPRWSTVAPGARVAPVAPNGRAARVVWGEWGLGPALRRGEASRVLLAPHYTLPAHCPVPVVVTVHDLTFLDHPEWHERSKVPYFRRALRVAARRAAAVICVSESTASRFSEHYRPAAPVVVIPHGVDHERFRTTESFPGGDRATLDRLGVDHPYLLFLGTIEPRKDVLSLLRAFERIAGGKGSPGDPPLELVLAGQPGWGIGELEKAIAASPVHERVRRLGYVAPDDVPALLRRAEAVVYPSLAEGFGLPALEALACGAPLVTTSGTAMAELAGTAAVLVPPQDDRALAEALEAVLGGGEAIERRRSEGLAIAAAHTWSSSARAHLEVLRTAADGQ